MTYLTPRVAHGLRQQSLGGEETPRYCTRTTTAISTSAIVAIVAHPNAGLRDQQQ
jgi:hypothetical protein